MGEPLDPVLVARGLYHIYREGDVRTVALRGAEVVLEHASWTTVMGPSGSGKSTLLHILAGLVEPSAGSVIVDGADVTRLPPALRADWRRRSVGLVLQRDNLHPHLDVVDNISLPLRLQGRPAPEIEDRVDALVEQVGLGGRRHHRVGQLSGGEAQRAAVAVALAPRSEGAPGRRTNRRAGRGDGVGRPRSARSPSEAGGDGHSDNVPQPTG